MMRFYFQDKAAGNFATKCIRVSSTATTQDVIETLAEKFRPDMRMLSSPKYSLYEVHVSGGQCVSPPVCVGGSLAGHRPARFNTAVLFNHISAVLLSASGIFWRGWGAGCRLAKLLCIWDIYISPCKFLVHVFVGS